MGYYIDLDAISIDDYKKKIESASELPLDIEY